MQEPYNPNSPFGADDKSIEFVDSEEKGTPSSENLERRGQVEMSNFSPGSPDTAALYPEEEKGSEKRNGQIESHRANEKMDIYNLKKKDLSNSKVIIECANLSKGIFIC